MRARASSPIGKEKGRDKNALYRDKRGSHVKKCLDLEWSPLKLALDSASISQICHYFWFVVIYLLVIFISAYVAFDIRLKLLQEIFTKIHSRSLHFSPVLASVPVLQIHLITQSQLLNRAQSCLVKFSCTRSQPN